MGRFCVLLSLVSADLFNLGAQPPVQAAVTTAAGVESVGLSAPAAAAEGDKLNLRTISGIPTSVMANVVGASPTVGAAASPTVQEIPADAAGGLGAYLHQIAAQLSVELHGETTSTGLAASGGVFNSEPGFPSSSSSGDVVVISTTTEPGWTSQPSTGLPSASGLPSAGAPAGLSAFFPTLPIRGFRVAAVNDLPGTVGVAEVQSGETRATEFLLAQQTGAGFPAAAGAASDNLVNGSPRSNNASGVSTAAAVGGFAVLLGGSYAIYSRSRASQPELSRFGSPQRRTGSELPRRFIPV